MALTRKMLGEYGLTEEQVETIINGHMETVNGLQNEITGYKDLAKKYEQLKTDSDQYKADVAERDLKRKKDDVVRAYYTSAGITGKNLEIAMKASREEINAAELDGDKIKDCSVFDSLVSGDYACLVGNTIVRGADTPTPLENNGSFTMGKAEIMGIRDTAERQKAWAEFLKQKGE